MSRPGGNPEERRRSAKRPAMNLFVVPALYLRFGKRRSVAS
jgi:hypothetical protein